MLTKTDRFISLIWQVGSIVVLLGIWQMTAVVNPSPYVPTLNRILLVLTKLFYSPLFFDTIAPSLYRFMVGFLLAVFIGITVGITIGYLKSVEAWSRPVLEYLRFIPAVAILPAALMVFGGTDFMRIFIIALGSVFPVLLAAIDGARRVEPVYIEVAKVSRLNTWQTVLRVILPAALPLIFSGIRIALSIGLVMMVISELLAANNGIGYYILRSQRLFRTADVYAGVIVIGIMGFVLTAVLLWIEKKALAWHKGWLGAK